MSLKVLRLALSPVPFFLLQTITTTPVHASMFESSIHLPPSEKRCLGQDLLGHTLMMATLTSEPGGPTISVDIMEDKDDQASQPHSANVQNAATLKAQGLMIFSESNQMEVRTAFTSKHDGIHWVCVSNDSESQGAQISVKISTGRHQNYEVLKKRDHLDPVEVS